MTQPRLPLTWTPEVAGRQGGVFTLRQALDAGATPAEVRSRRASGRWVRVAGRAWASAGSSLDGWSLAHAASLTWPDAVVAGASAALLHRMPVSYPSTTTVILRRSVQRQDGLRAIRTELDAAERSRMGGLSVTSAPRTLLDCLGWLPHPEAERLAGWAVTRGLTDTEAIHSALAGRGPRRGDVQRRRIAAGVAGRAVSEAERRAHRLLRGAGITGWTANSTVRDDSGDLIGSADILFERERVVIEIDGAAHHATPRAFQSDRARQNRLVMAGYLVLRFTWADLTERGPTFVAQVKDALARAQRR